MSITVSQLSKQYGPVTALDGVSLTLEDGKIYGLLGRNGAGKSTLMKLMSDRIRPTAGEILVDGKSVHNNTGRIYMMSEDNLYVDSMKVRDIFRWTGEFYGGFDQALADRLCEEFLQANGENSLVFRWFRAMAEEKKYGYQLLIREYGKNEQQAWNLHRSLLLGTDQHSICPGSARVPWSYRTWKDDPGKLQNQEAPPGHRG